MWTNGLTMAEEERLKMLKEEAAEVILAASKTSRHGWRSWNPDAEDKERNRGYLEREAGDFLGILRFMADCGDIDMNNVETWAKTKMARSWRYTHFQGEVPIMAIAEELLQPEPHVHDWLPHYGMGQLEPIEQICAYGATRPLPNPEEL